MENSLNILIKIMNDYKQTTSKNKQDLKNIKELTHKRIIETINKDIDTETNNPRLQNYLEKTSFSKLDFLYRSLAFTRGNNLDGPLTAEKLVFLNSETSKTLENYHVTTEFQLFDLIVNYLYNKRMHPLLTDQQFVKAWNHFHTLAYLDEFFRDINNCLAYQGSYTTYKYVKRYLKEALVEDNHESDEELIYKNSDAKIKIVSKNLISIANEMLTLRNSVPNSRLSICNQGLKKNANKKTNSPLTFEQKIFINSIAFGTTLEKLENENYEDAKQLLFLPHQRITK